MKHIFQKFLSRASALRLQNFGKTAQKPLFDKSLLYFSSSCGELNFIKLGIPVVLELFLNNIIVSITTFICNYHSKEAVIATGTVNVLFNMFTGLFASLSVGIAVLISNCLGADKNKNAQKTAFSGVSLNFIISFVLFILLYVFCKQIAFAMRLTRQEFTLSVKYIKIRSVELVFAALSAALLATLRCYGFSKSTVVIGLIKNCFVLLFSLYAIRFAKAPCFLGVSGVALGYVISNISALLISICVLIKSKIKLTSPNKISEFTFMCRQTLQVGIPSCISNTSFNISQIFTNSFAVMMGSTATTNKIYLSNLLCFLPIFSGSAGQINSLMIGRLYGAGKIKRADRLNKTLSQFTIPLNILLTLTFMLFRIPLLSIYTNDPAVFKMSASIIFVDIIIEGARGSSHIYEYACSGVRSIKPIALITFTSCWIFGVGLSYLLGITLGFGLIGCYIGLAVDELVRAITSFAIWKNFVKKEISDNTTEKSKECLYV